MFKFIKIDRDGQIAHTHEVEDVTWMEVTELFQQFLSGCGYNFKNDFDMAAILEEAHFKDESCCKEAAKKPATQSHKASVNAKLPFGLGDFR
jgi:hypothetical protein